jgi:Flp pilus assembly protein TadD
MTYPPCSDAKCKHACGWKEPSGSSGTAASQSGPTNADRASSANREGVLIFEAFQRETASTEERKQWLLEMALEEFLKALRLNPTPPVYRKNASQMYTLLAARAARDGKLRQAERLLQQALPLNPSDARIPAMLRDIRERLGDKARLNEVGPRIQRWVEDVAAELAGPGGRDAVGSLSPMETTAGTAAPGAQAAPAGSTPVDSSVVDLRHLDPDRPIVVDPNIPKGRPRRIAAQASVETLSNPSYLQGFDALRRGDPAAAIKSFQEALRARPEDPLVRNALGLAEDVLKARQQKQERRAQALHEVSGAIHALRENDMPTALERARRAHQLQPEDLGIRDGLNLIEGMYIEASASRERPGYTVASRMAGQSLSAVARADYEGAVQILREAHRLDPKDRNIKSTLDYVEGLRDGSRSPRGPGAPSPAPAPAPTPAPPGLDFLKN